MLESVVVQLQESCRETNKKNLELCQENSRLRRELENYWEQARKSLQSTRINNPIPTPFSGHSARSSVPLPPPVSPGFIDHLPLVPFTSHDEFDGSHPDHRQYDTRFPLPTALSPRHFPTDDGQVTPDAVSSSSSYALTGSNHYQNAPDSNTPNGHSTTLTSLPVTPSYQQDLSTQTHFEYRGPSGPSLPQHSDVTSLRARITDCSSTGQHPESAHCQDHAENDNASHRSHSLGPPLSSTVAVIKFHAFGGLRHTRVIPETRTSGNAARVALDVLNARGIQVGVNKP